MNTKREATIGLFPLTSHILPGGRMQLRIFEPRYLRLIRESLKAEAGFGLCMLNSEGNKEANTHILPTGTLVTVVDFQSLSDGHLGITIEGQQIFDVQEVWTENDGLRKGHVIFRESPVSGVVDEIGEQDTLIMERLREVFENYPEFAALYPEKRCDEPMWAYHRWLEILPLHAEKKQALLQDNDPRALRHFLHELFVQD